MRAAGAFVAGLATGAVLLYAALSSTGGLTTGGRVPPPSAAPGPLASAAPSVPMLPTAEPTAPPSAVESAAPIAAEPFAAQPTFTVPPPTLNPDSQLPEAQAPAPLPKETMAPPDVAVSELEVLRARNLAIPVAGVLAKALRDTFAEKRGNRVHEAIDILAPRGTPVLAAGDGAVVKLFNSAAGGLTVYQFDPEKTYCYYYAHLDRYAPGLAEGQVLRKGDRIGDVGTTGNAPPDTPHLHFTIFKLGPEKRWWVGTAINPYPLWALR